MASGRSSSVEPPDGRLSAAGPTVPWLTALAASPGPAALTIFAIPLGVAALGVLLAQLLSYWLRGNRPGQALHPGYFLPTAAGGFVSSIGLSLSDWHQAAKSAFGVGLFCWLIVGSLIFRRLCTGPPLPDALKPSLAVLASPPATAGIAWLCIRGATMNAASDLLLAVAVSMLAIQVMLFPQYRALAFTPNFWTFTFPLAASASFIIRWISVARFPGWQAWAWSIAWLMTVCVTAIAVATFAQLAGNHDRPASGAPAREALRKQLGRGAKGLPGRHPPIPARAAGAPRECARRNEW
jgi:tellurite resistance protein